MYDDKNTVTTWSFLRGPVIIGGPTQCHLDPPLYSLINEIIERFTKIFTTKSMIRILYSSLFLKEG